MFGLDVLPKINHFGSVVTLYHEAGQKAYNPVICFLKANTLACHFVMLLVSTWLFHTQFNFIVHMCGEIIVWVLSMELWVHRFKFGCGGGGILLQSSHTSYNVLILIRNS